MSNTQEFIFVWKIHNFDCAFYPRGEAIDSPIFRVNNFGGSEWCIRLYPSGEIDDNVLSVYLYKKKSDIYSEESYISFDCEMIADNGKRIGQAKTEMQICKVNERIGWYRFLSTKSVSDALEIWPKNVLIVRCHLFKTREQGRPYDVEVRCEIPVNQISFLWNLKISDILSKFVSKDIIFSNNPIYELALSMPDDVLKICLSQKEDSILPSFVECKLSLIEPNGNVLKSESSTHLFRTNDKSGEWDFPSFITKTELDHYSKCWGSDNLSFFCKIAATNGTKPIATSSGCSGKEIEGNSTVLKDFKTMLNNHIHSDTKLKVGKEELLAHKSILAVRSPVFSAMFDQDMIESKTGVIDVSDFEPDIVKLFLEFLYTDSIENFDCDAAKKLFMIADKYQVKSLVEKCAAFLESVLALENAIDILSLSDMIGHECLKKAAMYFIAKNSTILFLTKRWNDLMQENATLAGEIISNIALNFKIVPNT